MTTEQKYLDKIHRRFGAGVYDKKLFSQIAATPSQHRKQILQEVTDLIKRRGLAYGLLALYRQQVNCGFVLGDPLNPGGKENKRFKDQTTGVEFRLLWNPDRELRKNHSLLIKRGVITGDVDQAKLVNKDKKGKPCYLCKENIAAQNPAEILFPLRLAGKDYLAGANFAYIENNHFTVIISRHHDQQYERHILAAMIDLVEQTDGFFRAVFNGLAGATILRHEHLQAVTEPFPVEGIRVHNHDIVFQKKTLRVSRPFYYTPLWLVEGKDRNAVIDTTDRIIVQWHKLDRTNHTENVIAVKSDGFFRMFIFLRDTKRLAGERKLGDLASFECGGSIVFSYPAKSKQTRQTNERSTFDNADVNTVRMLLADIAPVVPDADFGLHISRR
jgi:hypothetical protein